MFSKILKDLRIENNLIQKELGQKLGISLSSISMYERGERQPDLETLIKIAVFFNVTTDYLLGCSDTPNFRNTNQQKTQSFNPSEFLTSSEKKIIKLFQRLKSEKFKEKAIKQFETYVDTLAELEAEFEELEETGSVKPDSVPSTQ